MASADCFAAAHNVNRMRLDQLLAGIARQRLLVIGDYFLDLYLDIDQRLAETSIETGLEAHQVVRRRTSAGMLS